MNYEGAVNHDALQLLRHECASNRWRVNVERWRLLEPSVYLVFERMRQRQATCYLAHLPEADCGCAWLWPQTLLYLVIEAQRLGGYRVWQHTVVGAAMAARDPLLPGRLAVAEAHEGLPPVGHYVDLGAEAVAGTADSLPRLRPLVSQHDLAWMTAQVQAAPFERDLRDRLKQEEPVLAREIDRLHALILPDLKQCGVDDGDAEQLCHEIHRFTSALIAAFGLGRRRLWTKCLHNKRLGPLNLQPSSSAS